MHKRRNMRLVQSYINLKGIDEDVFLIRDGERIPYKDSRRKRDVDYGKP